MASIIQYISILFSPAPVLNYTVVRIVIFEYECMHVVLEYKYMHLYTNKNILEPCLKQTIFTEDVRLWRLKSTPALQGLLLFAQIFSELADYSTELGPQ